MDTKQALLFMINRGIRIQKKDYGYSLSGCRFLGKELTEFMQGIQYLDVPTLYVEYERRTSQGGV